MLAAVKSYGDYEMAAKLLSEHPEISKQLGPGFLADAARYSTPEIVELLVQHGWELDHPDAMGRTALKWAVSFGRYAQAKKLLELGANPDLSCPLFSVASDDCDDPIAMTRLLLDHGASVNAPHITEGMPVRNALSRAIELGNEELAEFLRAHGARLPDPKLEGVPLRPAVAVEAGDYTAQILKHFEKRFGKPATGGVQQIVPGSEYAVSIHSIPSLRRLEAALWFTVGMSRLEMNVPRGAEAFRLAELFVRVPKSWPAPQEAIKDERFAWPIQWLMKLAAYPHEHGTWLGGPSATFVGEDPAEPLGAGTHFTAWLMASPESKDTRIIIDKKAKKTVNLYQLFPLYPEEYRYEREHGFAKLLQQITKHGLPEEIENERPSVVETT